MTQEVSNNTFAVGDEPTVTTPKRNNSFVATANPSPAAAASPKPMILTCKLRSRTEFVFNSPLSAYTNIFRFFKHTTPSVSMASKTLKQRKSKKGPAQNSNAILNSHCYQLRDIWNFYDDPYGVEVPVTIKQTERVYDSTVDRMVDSSVLKSEYVYFVPHLSALQIYTKDKQADKSTKLSTSTIDAIVQETSITNVRRELFTEDKGTTATKEEEEEEDVVEEQQSNEASPNTSSTTPQSSLLFEYFETLKPDLRYPLIDTIEEISKKFPKINTLSSHQFDTSKSWYSIAWYPILCHNSTINWLKGQIITYHSFELGKEFTNDHYCPLSSTPVSKSQEQYISSLGPISSPSLSSLSATKKTEEEKSKKRKKHLSDVYYLPVIGFIPYKVRNETWFLDHYKEQFAQTNAEALNKDPFSAPLYLVKAASNLLEKMSVAHPDYEHCLKSFYELSYL